MHTYIQGLSSACRLLCIKLTDGKASCKALEMRPLQGAEGNAVAPGAKVLLAGAAVKAGIVLVDSRSLKVLLPPTKAQDHHQSFLRLQIAAATLPGDHPSKDVRNIRVDRHSAGAQ